jgi:hypothetical protein
LNCSLINPKSKIQNPKSKIQNPKSKIGSVKGRDYKDWKPMLLGHNNQGEIENVTAIFG